VLSQKKTRPKNLILDNTFKLGLVTQSFNTATGGQERDATGFLGLKKSSFLTVVKQPHHVQALLAAVRKSGKDCNKLV
jgi:hypothetical protein